MRTLHFLMTFTGAILCLCVCFGCKETSKPTEMQIVVLAKSVGGLVLSKGIDGTYIESDGQGPAKLRRPSIGYCNGYRIDKPLATPYEETVEIDAVSRTSDNQGRIVVVKWSKRNKDRIECSIAQAYLLKGGNATPGTESIVYSRIIQRSLPYRVRGCPLMAKLEIKISGRLAGMGTVRQLTEGILVKTADNGLYLLPISNYRNVEAAAKQNHAAAQIGLWGRLLSKKNRLFFEASSIELPDQSAIDVSKR